MYNTLYKTDFNDVHWTSYKENSKVLNTYNNTNSTYKPNTSL